jgi:predicted  nucleic acid-binding Zn-ribbon protein
MNKIWKALIILVGLLLIINCAFSYFSYKQHLETIEDMKKAKKDIDYVNDHIFDNKKDIDDLKATTRKHEYRLDDIESNVDNLYKWSNRVVKWARQF